jgi:hypothetical protein
MSIRLHMITLILLTIVAMFLGVLLGIGFMLAAGVFLGMLGWGESVPTEVLLLLIPLTVVAVEWAVVAALKRVPARCEVIVCGGNAYCIGINPIAYVPTVAICTIPNSAFAGGVMARALRTINPEDMR